MSAPVPVIEPMPQIEGVAVPFDYSNVDTDALFPVSAEAVARRQGFGLALFARWRADPAFILNRPEYANASILVAGPDFGIGSSRETAVWALTGAGYRAVIAPSFGEIFSLNCTRNRLLAATLPEPACRQLQTRLRAEPGAQLRIDLRTATAQLGHTTYPLGIGEFARHCLVEGLDELGILLDRRAAVDRLLAARGSTWRPTTDIAEARSTTDDRTGGPR